MNLRRLKYFVKIVDIGSLTQAAEVLHIAQPALSQQLATLEGELNQQLLIRSKRGVMPTAAGNILYAHAQSILRQCELAQSAVYCAGQAMSGRVAVGVASGSAAVQFALPLLQALGEQYPDILLSLHEHDGATLASQVENGRLDMAVLCGGATSPSLSTTVLAKEELYLVAARTVSSPGNSIDLTDVSRFNLFLPHKDDRMRNQLDEAMAVRRLTYHVIAEIASPATLSAAVASGMGATILPESAARAMIGSGKAWMARITRPVISIPLSLCVSAQQPLSATALAVQALLVSMVGYRSQEKRTLALVQ
ncbi:nitrogen assimilation transcriptional regulator NAC [Serratia sp. NPDC078593]|uniref:nitrogen assimilation transcriptional regulator NAC n=1 Tax=unclassified Serratia (in: enterobacteria) TaxID=2647522 RepID=UPI0037D6ABF8